MNDMSESHDVTDELREAARNLEDHGWRVFWGNPERAGRFSAKTPDGELIVFGDTCTPEADYSMTPEAVRGVLAVWKEDTGYTEQGRRSSVDIEWRHIDDEKPEPDQSVLVTDGRNVDSAIWFPIESDDSFPKGGVFSVKGSREVQDRQDWWVPRDEVIPNEIQENYYD